MLSKHMKHILEAEDSYFLKALGRMISVKHYFAHFQKPPKTITKTPSFIHYEIQYELHKHDGNIAVYTYIYINGNYPFAFWK
jgi:hypothetical protein